mgnify:CR=1 FL=1
MKADFFIDRPVFSTVLSIIIVIVGSSAWHCCPSTSTPRSYLRGAYLGVVPRCRCADRDAGRATPIEQELNGTPGMIYMESSSSNSGGFSATVTFDISTDPDLAAVDIQNRLKKPRRAFLPKWCRTASRSRSRRPAS